MGDSKTGYNVLFLDRGDCARGIMACAILNREGMGRFCAYSAGINAHASLDANAVALLSKLRFDVSALRPTAWRELTTESEGSPIFDFVFMVSDDARLLPRSVWKGNPIFAQWSIPDPARVDGNEAQIQLAYADTFRMLSNRIGIFINLPLRSLDLAGMQDRIDTIENPASAASASTVAA